MAYIVLLRKIEQLVEIKLQRLMYAKCKDYEADSNIR